MTIAAKLIVVEGRLEAPAAKKLISRCGIRTEAPEPIIVGSIDKFWQVAPKYNQAAASIDGYIIGLCDLEKRSNRLGNDCPVTLLQKAFPPRRDFSEKHSLHPNFLLRIAVIELEAWLLADTMAMAKYLAVSSKLLPDRPDDLVDAKREVVNLARRSRRRSIREQVVPGDGQLGIVGREYTTALGNFIEESWDPLSAAEKSPSLRRAVNTLSRAAAK
jgi:hypothetical protein